MTLPDPQRNPFRLEYQEDLGVWWVLWDDHYVAGQGRTPRQAVRNFHARHPPDWRAQVKSLTRKGLR